LDSYEIKASLDSLDLMVVFGKLLVLEEQSFVLALSMLE